MGRTGGAAARGFGKGTAVVRGPRGIPSVVSATATVGGLDLAWTNGDATAQTRIYNGATLLATANAAATTYSVTGLTGATAYTLTVKHFKDSVDSVGANFNSTTTSLASPNSLSISSTGVSFSAPDVLASITLNWANGDASAQTRIYSGVTLVATANAAATSYSVTDTLGASVSYTVYHYKNSIESPSNSSTSGTAASYGTLNFGPGSHSFIFPTTWNASNNSITVIGGGGSGENGETGPGNGGGGGGSGYKDTRTNVASGGGTTYTLTVGSSGKSTNDGYGSRDGGTSYFTNAPSGGTIQGDGGYAASGASGGSGQYTGGAGGTDVYRHGGSGAGTGGNGTSGNNPNDPGNTPPGGAASSPGGSGGNGGPFLNGWQGGSGDSGDNGGGGGGGASGYNNGAAPGNGARGGEGLISITWGA